MKAVQRFGLITERVERAAQAGLDAAARQAAIVAQANASINLELEVKGARGELDGYSAGIKSRRKSSRAGKATPIARFFDEGTLGKRRKPVKRGRKKSWTQTRGGTSYTAERRDIDGKGIEPEHFFPKARNAGRKAMLEQIDRNLP